MRIAIFTTYANKILRARKELVEKIIEDGHELVIMGPEEIKGEEENFRKNGIKYCQVKMVRNNTNPFKELVLIRELKKLFQKEKIESLLVYGIRTFPSVVISAKMVGIKNVVCIVNGLGHLFMMCGWKANMVRMISFPMLKVAFRLADKIFVQNEDDYAELQKHHLLGRGKKEIINGSGVNVNELQPKELPSEDICLMISRLTGDKGINEYLRAAEILYQEDRKIQMWLIGPKDDFDASLNVELFEKLCQHGVIRYFGEIKNVETYLAQCRYYVLPSYREGTPRTVLEAMAIGRPIITTDVPGCRQTVENKKNGLLIPAKKADDLATSILWMTDHPAEVEKMAQMSRKIVEEKYNVYDINKKIIKSLV